MTHPLDPAEPAGGSGRDDSAGVPWGGRTLPPGGYEGDDGSADAGLAEALRARAAGTAVDADVVAALAAARLLVPVVTVPVVGKAAEAGVSQAEIPEVEVAGAADRASSGAVGGDAADMALVTLTGPGGQRALPLFSCVAALAAWDPAARPVPTDCRRAAASAVAEGCDLLVLDPAGPVTFVVSRPAVWALGQGRPWVPAHEDPDVVAVLRAAAAYIPEVVRVRPEPGRSAQLRVVVAVAADLSAAQVQVVAAQVSERLSASEVLRERVDGVELALVRA